MKIAIHKFGEILVSRPSGQEAFLVMKSYHQPTTADELIELDFSGVKVLAPSWLDEVLTGLKSLYGERVVCLPCSNASVKASISFLAQLS